MSLLNIYIKPNLALIGVDTNAHSLVGGSACEISKFIALPHANVLLATRGVNKFLLEVFAAAFYTPSICDFDSTADWIVPAMEAGFENYVSGSMQQGLKESDLREVELAVVGWSKRINKMAGNVYLRGKSDQAFKTKPVEPWHISPNAGWGPNNIPPTPDSPALMKTIARAQVEWIADNHPGHPIGGRLIMAEISKDRMTIGSVAALNGPGRK